MANDGTGDVTPKPNLSGDRFDEILRTQKLGGAALTAVKLNIGKEQIESMAAGMAMDKMDGYNDLEEKARKKGIVDENGVGDVAAYKKTISYKLGNALKVSGQVAVVGGAFMIGSFAGAGAALMAMGLVKPMAKSYRQHKAFKENYNEIKRSLVDSDGNVRLENVAGAEDIKERVRIAAAADEEDKKELLREGEEAVVERRMPEIERNKNKVKGQKLQTVYEAYLDYLEKVALEGDNNKDSKREVTKAGKRMRKEIKKNKVDIDILKENLDDVTGALRGVFVGENAPKSKEEHAKARDAIDRYLRENLKVISAKVDAGLGVSEKEVLTLSEKVTLKYGAILGAGMGLAASVAKMNGRTEISKIFGGSTAVGAVVAGAMGALGGGLNKYNTLAKDNRRQALSGVDGEKDKTSYDILNVGKAAEKLRSYFGEDGKLLKDLDEAKIHEIKEIIADFKARSKMQNKRDIALLSYEGRGDVEKSRLEMLTTIAKINKELRPMVEKYDDVIEQMIGDRIEAIEDSMNMTKKQQRRAVIGAAAKTGLLAGGIAFAIGAGMKGLMRNEAVAVKMADVEKWRQGKMEPVQAKLAGIFGLSSTAQGGGQPKPEGGNAGGQPDGEPVGSGEQEPDGEAVGSVEQESEVNFEADKNGKNVIFADMDNDGKPEVYLDTNHDGVLDAGDYDAESFSMDMNGDGKIDIDDLKVSDGLRIDERGKINTSDLNALNKNLKKFGYGIKGEQIDLDTTHEVMQSKTVGEYLESDGVKTATFEKRVWHDGTGVGFNSGLRGVDYDGDGTFDAWRVNVSGTDEVDGAQVALTLKDELGMKTVQVLDIQNTAEGGSYVDIPMGLASYRNGSENMGKLLAEYAEVVKVGDNGVMDVYSTITGSGAIGDAVKVVTDVADKGFAYDFRAVNTDGTWGESFGSVNISDMFRSVENFVNNASFDQVSREQMHYTEKTVTVGGETVRDVDVTRYNPKTDQYYAYEGSGENGELYAAADVTKNKVVHFGLANNIKTDVEGNIVNQAEVVQQQINGIATTPEIALTYATSEGSWCDESYIENVLGHDVPGLDGVIDTQDEFNIVVDLMRQPDSGLHVAIANDAIDNHLSLLDGGRLALEKIGVHKTAYSYFGNGDDVNVNLGTTKYTTEEILVGYDKTGARVTDKGTMGLILGEDDGAIDGWGRWCGSQPKKVIVSAGSENSEASEGNEATGTTGSEDSESSENSETSEGNETTGSEGSEDSETSESEESGSETSENEESGSETSENEESGSETSETIEVQAKDAINEQRIVDQAPSWGEVTPTDYEDYTSGGETSQPGYVEPTYEEIPATTDKEFNSYVDDILNETLDKQQRVGNQ